MKRNPAAMGRYLCSSTGQKYLMAISGAALVGFVIAHLLGNLQIFLGPEELNRYAAFLQNLGELLWIARISLIAMVGIHIWTAISLTLENRAARPIAYAQKRYVEATYASRTMHWSGVIVLAYIIFHLLDFTFLKLHPQYRLLIDPQGRHDVFSMVVINFQQPLIALFYMVANFLLGIHLSHGVYSMFQSLGLQNEAIRAKLRPASQAFGVLIFLGYASIPAAVLVGLVKLPVWVNR